MKKMDKKAFTLIELLVVIAVVGILVLLAAPRFTGYTQKAERIRIQHDTKVMEEEVGTVLINGDDEFNEWENNSKDYLNQLAQDNELFDKEGPVVPKDGEPIGGQPYKVIPEKYKDKINTKLKGTFYANKDGKVYYEHGKGPGYSDEEIEDKIKQGFIPVAAADELNNVRYDKTNLFGKGTKWEKEYIGGLDKQYIQVKDIDLSVYSAEGWSPIGTRSGEFIGTYDGGNYVITDLEIKGSVKDNQGLFGLTKGATISNVGLIDNKVTGSGWALGGLVGDAYESTIENSYATGSVEGSKWSLGGLVGRINSGTMISNSYATGTVTGSVTDGQSIGGLVGSAGSGTKIRNSYATGEVEGAYHVGGLVGAPSFSTIENSFATGKVTGKDKIGGLVGTADYRTNISNSYAKGEVSGRKSIGGLVGWTNSLNENRINISNSYAIGSVIGSEDVGGLVGNSQGNTDISNSYFTGSVESTGSPGFNIGGLVGRAVFSTTISNSYVTGSVKGQSSVGGLVGLMYSNNTDTTISNSYATGSVTATSSALGRSAGGLVGRTWKTTISNSYATGPVKGVKGEGSNIGGLVGKADDPSTVTVTNSYWDTVTTLQEESARGIGKSTLEMKEKSTYLDWKFDTIWAIQEGVSYPTLISNPERH